MRLFFGFVLVFSVVMTLSNFVAAQSYGVHSRDEAEIKSSDREYFMSSDRADAGARSAKDTMESSSADHATEPQPGQRRIEQISKAAKIHAERIDSACPSQWEKQACLKEVSDAYLTASALFAEDLEGKGYKDELENIKKHCSASTAATGQSDIPAYAMRSAFVECSNEFYAIYERTKVMPDQELSQLMVMAVLCMDKDQRCSLMETGLKASLTK